MSEQSDFRDKVGRPSKQSASSVRVYFACFKYVRDNMPEVLEEIIEEVQEEHERKLALKTGPARAIDVFSRSTVPSDEDYTLNPASMDALRHYIVRRSDRNAGRNKRKNRTNK